MSGDVHVTIGEIRVSGLGRAEATAAVDALRSGLPAALSAALVTGPDVEKRRTPQGGRDLGRAAARAIAATVATRLPGGGR
ncbi:MAG: hypothetical protein NVSMB48_13240 [Marmoricola sp.]